MADPTLALEVLGRLHRLGVGLAVDDFGTGYSSMAYLKELPVDELKIDRSFVSQMAISASDAVIVRSTIDLGHNLGLRVVAEGVETQHAWEQLSELGCDIAQGYYLGRPMPAADLEHSSVKHRLQACQARRSSQRFPLTGNSSELPGCSPMPFRAESSTDDGHCR